MGNKILLIEDTTELAALITLYLNKEGMEIKPVESGEEALTALESFQPELVLLDLNLPGMGGSEFLQIFRKTSQVPVLIISARDSEEDIIQGLGDGADEYITKPFSPKVLVARVKTVLRRSREQQARQASPQPKEDQQISIHGLSIIPHKFVTSFKGTPIVFSATEFSILHHLASHPGRVFSRIQIINDIKGSSYPVTERSIDVQILSIRKKLAEAAGNPAAANMIETVRGVGYRFVEELDLDGH